MCCNFIVINISPSPWWRECWTLTCVLQAAIREGQQRSIQGALGVLQDGIVLVDVLHDFRVEFILLEIDSSAIIFTIKWHTAVRTLGLRVCLSVRGDWGWSDHCQNSALASFKAEERSTDGPANHISMTNCLPAVQMASRHQPSSTCCLLEMLPLCLHKTKKSYLGVKQSWQILLKRLWSGDRLVYLKWGNKMPLRGNVRTRAVCLHVQSNRARPVPHTLTPLDPALQRQKTFICTYGWRATFPNPKLKQSLFYKQWYGQLHYLLVD